MNTKYWSIDDYIDQAVMVYHDPITKLDPEGIAVLVDPVRFDCAGDLSLWMVQFLSEPKEYYQRTIDRKDIIIE